MTAVGRMLLVERIIAEGCESSRWREGIAGVAGNEKTGRAGEPSGFHERARVRGGGEQPALEERSELERRTA